MSFVYIPLAGGAQLADTLSRGVYKLSHPGGVIPAGYVTTHAFGWLVHPESGAVVLILDAEQFIPLHVAADTGPLLDLLADLKDDDDHPLTTPEERAQLDQVVRYFGGSTVPLEYLVPAKAMADAKTREQLEQEGWFPVPELP